MCGIAGLWEFKADRSNEDLRHTIQNMSDVLTHRGPDGSGVWADETAGLAFGHRRLSIVDLSDAGTQPMMSRDERYVITFNGEIYNFQEIRSQLEPHGITFRGHSDTEILLEAIATWGLEATIAKCIGMFAFAVWDRKLRELMLVRDRMGVKPLYYTVIDQRAVLFASQSKSFLKHPYFRPVISLESTTGYLQHGYLPKSRSIYEHTEQLLPGHIVRISAGGTIRKTRYWSLPTDKLNISEHEASERLHALLQSSIALRMRADVPVGAFVSGGVDSSTVAAYMQHASSKKIKTFCIGFTNPALDESRYARAVAQHLGTDHTEVIMDEKEIMSLIPVLPMFYDEPFADFSMLPTMLVSHIARAEVTVCLSGDGGDELFAGYERYKIAKMLSGFNAPLWRTLMPAAKQTPEGLLTLVGKMTGLRITRQRIEKFSQMLEDNNDGNALARFYSLWHSEFPMRQQENRFVDHMKYIPKALRTVEDMQRLDAELYLPDDILTKVDRSSMAFSLEAREPLLDHRLVEFAFSLPQSHKIKRGKMKYLLRKALYQYVPASIIERPKQGFSPPLNAWLKSPLCDWADSMLSPDSLGTDGIFDPGMVRQIWQDHLNGVADYSHALWTLLMFQSWKQHYAL